ncbi:hypothetical protein Zm00014a_031301 [Zea mays]|uniref:Uncharacterized protein n=1 Tax=Zea mays TaxID=4577 RepID=A0A3L6D8S7_MAIZE|nr:hypothetical protein Zm00014a_031301 [Zea mays]
MCMQSMIN